MNWNEEQPNPTPGPHLPHVQEGADDSDPVEAALAEGYIRITTAAEEELTVDRGCGEADNVYIWYAAGDVSWPLVLEPTEAVALALELLRAVSRDVSRESILLTDGLSPSKAT